MGNKTTQRTNLQIGERVRLLAHLSGLQLN